MLAGFSHTFLSDTSVRKIYIHYQKLVADALVQLSTSFDLQDSFPGWIPSVAFKVTGSGLEHECSETYTSDQKIIV